MFAITDMSHLCKYVHKTVLHLSIRLTIRILSIRLHFHNNICNFIYHNVKKLSLVWKSATSEEIKSSLKTKVMLKEEDGETVNFSNILYKHLYRSKEKLFSHSLEK